MNSPKSIPCKRLWQLLGLVVCLAFLCDTGLAQPGRGRGGDRGGGGGDRGGDRGGGGRPGGDSGGGRGFGPPPPDRIFGYMDRNQDGKLDESEVSRMPGSFREKLEAQGLDFKKGVSKDKFVGVAGKAMEEARKERESGGDSRDRGRDGDRDDRRREDDRSSSKSSSSSKKGVASSMPKIQMNYDLPSSYTDLDTNLDGQIGLYEWRQWKPTELTAFIELDANSDGFLTPRELLVAEAIKKNGSPPKIEMPRVIVLGSAPKKAASKSTSSSSSSSSRDSKGRDDDKQVDFREQDRQNEKKGGEYFGYMDKNRNGRIDPEEWAASRKIRPWFQKEGIDVSRAMSRDEFVRHFVKLTGAR